MTGFQTFYEFISLQSFISNNPKITSVGVVPTMGALHVGHLSLIDKALEENDLVVVTIFVNPKQFNNPVDLEKYPRVPENDLSLLRKYERVAVCMPEVADVYPAADPYKEVSLGLLDTVLEGKFRPGHFTGVAHVVHNLIYFIKAQRAYFGLKDIQQLSVIKHMVHETGLQVAVVPCETVRDESGMALSSRNLLLSQADYRNATIIFKTLDFVRQKIKEERAEDVKKKAIELFNSGSLELEYLELVNQNSFEPYKTGDDDGACCIAAYCDGVRLIDNVLL
jgi:pantoate--beta-alanine ligase